MAVADPGEGGRRRSDRETSVSITSEAVGQIAARAAREIAGVHALGPSPSRSMRALQAQQPGAARPAGSPGVAVSIGGRQTTVHIVIAATYGSDLVAVAEAVRQNVIKLIRTMAGMEVTAVDVAIDDLHTEGPGDREQLAE